MRMNHHSLWAASCSLFALFTATPAFASDANTQSGNNNSDSYSLEDIVVTAQRREESLQDVPVAVTALNSEALANMRISNVSNLSAVAPNLQVHTAGIQSTPMISIRGVTSGTSNNAVDPKVGIYLDGVYVGRTVGSVFDLADIERIEVLRGPQGTLFGRNATSGAINLVTAAPKGEFGIKQDLSYGNHNAFRSRTILNLPAVGPLSIKASYLHDEIQGDVKNLIGGKTLDFRNIEPRFGKLTYAEYLGSRNIDAVQAMARLDLDQVVLDYRFDYTDSRSSGRAVQQLGLIVDPAPNAQPSPIGGILPYQPYVGGITNMSTTRLDKIANSTTMEHVTVSGHNFTATWNQSDAVTLKSITAFRKMNQRPNIHDLAATGGIRFDKAAFETLLTTPPGTQPNIDLAAIGPNDSVHSLLTARSTKQEQFSQEFQIQVTQDSYNLVAGAFYFEEKSPAIDVLGIFISIEDGVIVDGMLDDVLGTGVLEVIAKNKSVALYSQGTVHLSPTLDFSAGIRYTSDKRQTEILSVSAAQGAQFGIGTYKKNFDKFNYALILNWQPNNDVTAYAKVSTGYVAGGIMSGISYRPESLTAYELGLKTNFWNNRVRANAAAFLMNYKDMQTQNFINNVQRFDNAGKAQVRGFEGELDMTPVRGLTLSGNLGYTDFDYKEFILSNVDVTNIARPPYFSKWTGRASANFVFGEFANGGEPFANLSGRYRSHSYLTSTPLFPAATEKVNRTPGYWLVDARVGVNSLDFGVTTANLSLWAKNLFNKDVRSWGAPTTSLTGIYEWRRTYGVDLSVAF